MKATQKRAERLLIAAATFGPAQLFLASWCFESGLVGAVVPFTAFGGCLIAFFAAAIHLANSSTHRG